MTIFDMAGIGLMRAIEHVLLDSHPFGSVAGLAGCTLIAYACNNQNEDRNYKAFMSGSQVVYQSINFGESVPPSSRIKRFFLGCRTRNYVLCLFADLFKNVLRPHGIKGILKLAINYRFIINIVNLWMRQ